MFRNVISGKKTWDQCIPQCNILVGIFKYTSFYKLGVLVVFVFPPTCLSPSVKHLVTNIDLKSARKINLP